MTGKQTEAFYKLGLAMGHLVNAMGQTSLESLQSAHSICKFRDKITRRQQLAIWILDTAERFADWVAGEDHD